MLATSTKIWHVNKRDFLQQCLGMFTMLILELSSETRVFRHLSNHVFEVRNCGNTKTYEGHRFIQNVLNLRYIAAKN